MWNPFNRSRNVRYFSCTTSRYNSTIHTHFKTNIYSFLLHFYFILYYFIQLTWQCIMHCVKLLNWDPNYEHNYSCGHLYLYILYHRPWRWPSDIETCCNIKDITYSTCVDGILFLVLTRLVYSVCWLLSKLPLVSGQAGCRRLQGGGFCGTYQTRQMLLRQCGLSRRRLLLISIDVRAYVACSACNIFRNFTFVKKI
jgi:hypothetical protein